MNKLTFLSDTASTQVEATLTARDLSEPLSPIRSSYDTTLIRLTDPIVVECVEYAVAADAQLTRKKAFSDAHRIQSEFVRNPETSKFANDGKLYGLRMAREIFDVLLHDKNPLEMKADEGCIRANQQCAPGQYVNSQGIELEKLFKILFDTQSQIATLLVEHLSYVRPA